MKKVFVSFAIACLMFLAGITLASCGTDYTRVSFAIDADSEDLMELVVKVDGKVVEGRGLTYNIEQGSNVRVELHAKTYGVDFSEVVVTVNGSAKTIVKNNNYDCAYGSEDLVYGNFALPNLEEDLNVTVTGVKQISITYDFDVQNVENETAIANMQLAFIEVDGEYKNLYEFATNPESVLQREYSAENYNSFNLIFGDVENGVDIFNLNNSNPTPFSLRGEDGTVVEGNCSLMSSGSYIVSFPNVTEQNYTIVIDFSDLRYKQYSVNTPVGNMNYSISAPDSLNYLTGGVITVTKSAVRKTLVYDNIKVFLNDLELSLDPDCDIAQDTNLNFIIPDKITPISTSNNGEAMYTITVTGIEYTDEAYEVSLPENEDDDVASMMEPKLYLLDENNEKVGEIPQEDGKYIVVKGEKVALFWQYNKNENNQIVSKYDLYDFDILIDDLIEVVEEPTEPGTEEPIEPTPEEPSETPSEDLEEQPTEETPEGDLVENPNGEIPEGEEVADNTEDVSNENAGDDSDLDDTTEENPEDSSGETDEEIPEEEPSFEVSTTTLSIGGKLTLAENADQIVELGGGYNLVAFYDEASGRFDALQLEFTCENDKEISFGNFKVFSEDIIVSHEIEDERYSSVDFAIISDTTNWQTLAKGEQKQLSVEVGQTVAFRFVGSTYASTSDFGITGAGLIGLNENFEVVTYRQGDTYFTEFRYAISYAQFTTPQEMKLVALNGSI